MQNHAIQTKRRSNFILRSGKNSNFVYTRLRYALKKLCMQKVFFGKCLFDYKIRFATGKKIWGNFETTLNNFCCRHKKMLVIDFPYVEVV